MKESPFIAVLKRELDRMVSRRIYFASCIVLPLFSIFFMATIFGNGQMENLPVGIVDGDNTATSREIIRMTEAVPTFRITRHYADEVEARADVQRKSIYGYLSIPFLGGHGLCGGRKRPHFGGGDGAGCTDQSGTGRVGADWYRGGGEYDGTVSGPDLSAVQEVSQPESGCHSDAFQRRTS